jgi:glucose/arabinose dehydrogenase
MRQVRSRRPRRLPRRTRLALLPWCLVVSVLVACGGMVPSPTPFVTTALPATATATVAATATVGGSATSTRAARATPVGGTEVPPTVAANQDALPLQPVTIRVPKSAGTTELTVDRTLNLPAGFQISVFAAGVKQARFMAWSPTGELVLSLEGTPGEVVILPDHNQDGRADQTIVFARNLRNPHGLAFRDGYLFIAEENQVVRFAWQGGQPAHGAPEVVVADLPSGAGHATRTLGFGPDGKLYVSIGSSCNVCQEKDERRATIMQYNADGSNGRIYARGLRNAVGFVWRPGATELWATNNGRDSLGDDLPPETVNLVRDGDDFGWPYCHNGHIPDPQFSKLGSCNRAKKPAVEMQAHSAPLGLAFYEGAAFPPAFVGDLLVAFHGSWNRSVPTGYKVVRVRFQNGQPTGQVDDFITGWRGADGKVWGRPVDPFVGPDGSLYISDDTLGVVYRVVYKA